MKSTSIVLSFTITLLLEGSAARIPSRIAGSPTTTLSNIQNNNAADVPAPAPTPQRASGGNKFLYARRVAPPTMPEKTATIPAVRKQATPSSTKEATRPRIMSPPTVTTGTIVDPITRHQVVKKYVTEFDVKDRSGIMSASADDVVRPLQDSSEDDKMMKNTPATAAIEKADEHQEILEGIVGGHLVESTMTEQEARPQFLSESILGSENHDTNLLQSFSTEEDNLASEEEEEIDYSSEEDETEDDDVDKPEDESKALEVFHNIMVDGTTTTINNTSNMTPADLGERSEASEESWSSREDSSDLIETTPQMDPEEVVKHTTSKKHPLKFGKLGSKDLEATEF